MGESLGRLKERNSKVELLRIISMWFIVAHHFVIHNAEPISVFPGTVARMVLHGVLYLRRVLPLPCFLSSRYGTLPTRS